MKDNEEFIYIAYGADLDGIVGVGMRVMTKNWEIPIPTFFPIAPSFPDNCHPPYPCRIYDDITVKNLIKFLQDYLDYKDKKCK